MAAFFDNGSMERGMIMQTADNKVTLEQTTEYPWNGKVTIKVTPEKTEFEEKFVSKTEKAKKLWEKRITENTTLSMRN